MTENNFKQGDRVKLKNCGKCYPYHDGFAINLYVRRYHPINVKPTTRWGDGAFTIEEWYGTPECLDKQDNLKWKIRFIEEKNDMTFIFISSSENHLLIINEKGIRKYDES